jgi:hypothetical protein
MRTTFPSRQNTIRPRVSVTLIRGQDEVAGNVTLYPFIGTIGSRTPAVSASLTAYKHGSPLAWRANKIVYTPEEISYAHGSIASGCETLI